MMGAQILFFSGVRHERHRDGSGAASPQSDPGDETEASRAPPLLIGLAGPIGTGKTTAAMHLIEARGFARIRFADPLKQMLANLLDTMGVPAETAGRMVDGDLKETPTPLLEGGSPRRAMQTLGAEWGRDLIGRDLWINAWRRAVSAAIAEAGQEARPARIVADDCRYPNEITAIRALGGRVIWIDRPGRLGAGHSSETSIGPADCDITIVNDGAIIDLSAAIAAFA
jgi:hypothetical protein